MRIGILGSLDLRDETGGSVEVGGFRLRALLVRLAIDAGSTVSSERLVDDLWADDPPAGASNALQGLVSRLRNAAGRELIESRPGGYRLALDPGEVDAVAFERLVTAGRAALDGGDPARAATLLRDALGLWRGPALAGVTDAPFAGATVARLEELRLVAVEDRAEAELALGRAAPLIPGLEELVAVHPYRERLRGRLMRALYATGRQADALNLYEQGRRMLADSLGVDPSPELAAVHLAILRGATEPEPAAVTAPRTNLPAPLTSFVGREDEIERVGKLLQESRLVTLTGPGGAGKTRLAGEVAARLLDQLDDGVWFVPLAPVRDGFEVAQSVLVALGIPEPVKIPEAVEGREHVRAADRLVDALSARRLLLILDNCEHLVASVATLADRILAAAPQVRILTTSREPLGITGETLCPVPSLPLPPEDVSAGQALEYSSVRLFADRAAAMRPGFSVDATTVRPVALICRALDGIPLAIELAASRLRSLTAGQVADRLDDRFRLLNAGSRTALPRHQTLRAIVDWSWELLDDAERTMLARLSVFSGGATPEAAEQVCGAGTDPRDVIDVIASLVDKSLVTATGEAEVRYGLLETVREYAAERLAGAGERDLIRSAHAAYYIALAERAEPELRGHDQLIWADRLTAERGNHAAALRHTVDTGDGVSGLRLCGGLFWFWMLRDHETEATEWPKAVLEITGDVPPAGLEHVYAFCVAVASISAGTQAGQDPTVEDLADTLTRVLPLVKDISAHPALALLRPMTTALNGGHDHAFESLMGTAASAPDPWTRATARIFAGHVALNQGWIDAAETQLDLGLEGLRTLGDRWAMIAALTGVAEVANARGRYPAAVRARAEAYAFMSEGVNPDQGSILLIHLGRAKADAGDLAAARADLERGILAADRTGHHQNKVAGHLALGELAYREGDLVKARAHLEQALEVHAPSANRPGVGHEVAMAYSLLGCLTADEGDLAESARWHARAIEVPKANSALPVNPTIAGLAEGLAVLAAARGEHGRAAELLGAAHALHGYVDATSTQVRRVTERASAALGEPEFQAAYARGRRMTRADILAQTP